MEIIRQFKKMNIWDFQDLMQEQCLNKGDSAVYFMYLDELKLRRIASVSEGGDHKLRSLAHELLASFKREYEKNKDFCSEKELKDFSHIVQNEI